MHTADISSWQHTHRFHSAKALGERNTRRVGATVVGVWAWGLLRETSRVLLDREMDSGVVEEIRKVLEADGETRVSELQVWRVGRGQFACAASIVTHEPKEPAFYKSLLSVHARDLGGQLVRVELGNCASLY